VTGVVGVTAVIGAGVLLAGPAGAHPLSRGGAHGHDQTRERRDEATCLNGTTTRVLASGGSLTGPDDITRLGRNVFVAYQNGVGSKGEPSASGATQSTVVEYTPAGRQVAQWPLTGKVDGMTADREHHRIVATVNEDGNSSLFTINPGRGAKTDAVRQYTYSPNPLPHGGGTDSIAIVNGALIVTASAPAAGPDGTTFTGPALYKVTLDGNTAHARGLFNDSSRATDAVTGKQTTLNLSDPDSSMRMPRQAPRFGGQLMLDSQGDSQEIFINHLGRKNQSASVLNLNTQVDDSAVATGSCGTLYVTDAKTDQVKAITGRFTPGQVFVSVPSDSSTLPGTLGTLDLNTGTVSPFSTVFGNPKGLLFVRTDRD
jgi:hypothetical protein